MILIIWTILILLLKWLITNILFIKHLIDGKPTVIIKHGQLDPEACRSKGLSASDVALKLRSQGIFQLKEVKRAVIEQNGQLIVVRAGDENPKYPIVTDGVIQTEILDTIGKTEDWLNEELQKWDMTTFQISSSLNMIKERLMLSLIKQNTCITV